VRDAVIVLGLDPGMASTGWGLVSCDSGHLTHLAHGALHTDRERVFGRDLDTAQRVALLSAKIADIIDRHHPGVVAIEAFSFHGAASYRSSAAASTGQVIGMIEELCRARGLPCTQLRAVDWRRRLLGGRGGGGKYAVQEAMRKLLQLAARPTPTHAADALGIAIVTLLAARLPRG
jgi:crossover junction endodeoxyribonuclease RuvC